VSREEIAVKLDPGGLGRDGFGAVDLNFVVVRSAKPCGRKNGGEEKAGEIGKTPNYLEQMRFRVST
jgi:hypothetical protein